MAHTKIDHTATSLLHSNTITRFWAVGSVSSTLTCSQQLGIPTTTYWWYLLALLPEHLQLQEWFLCMFTEVSRIDVFIPTSFRFSIITPL